ncbi:helix-turn-helix domain-containing protein [Streptomyces amakusaensis]|uniref:XRE family transcriptional regulator n=2 Tax=Streptomyces TaxID=1883 RepID=A0A918Q810_9ACTN|nr:XRE family transcriptional regulator [Streptomyces inusitatus]GGZ35729.1 XRE family transcriptional regulator [Streptomyces inusitatus]
MAEDGFNLRLNRLFETIHPPGRGPYTNQEVATLLRERGGPSLSHVYLWQLRTGRRDNPTRRHLEALASFFGVPVTYFFDDDVAEKVGAELRFVRQLRESGVQRVATRVAGLSPQSMEEILAAIDHIREREGRPALADDESPGEEL